MSDLQDICTRYNFSNFYTSHNMSSQKLKNAIATMNINSTVYGLFDSTVWGTGKSGFAICEDGLHWRNIVFDSKFITWKELKKCKITYDNSTVYLDSLDIYVPSVAKEAATLLSTIKINLKVDTAVSFFGFLENAANVLYEITSSSENTSTDTITSEENTLITEVEPPSLQPPPIPTPIQWSIAIPNQQLGPFTLEEARTWILSNKSLYQNIYVWNPNLTNWILASTDINFKDCFNSVSPPTPPC